MYEIISGHTKSKNGSTEENKAGNSAENAEEEVLEIHTLTQEAVNEQFRKFITPLRGQLEELIRLVQGMVTTPHPSHYLRTDYSATSGAALYQSHAACGSFCSTI